MRQQISLIGTLAMGLALAMSGCKSSNSTASGTQPVNGACPAGSQLQSDGTCSTANGSAATTNTTAPANSAMTNNTAQPAPQNEAVQQAAQQNAPPPQAAAPAPAEQAPAPAEPAAAPTATSIPAGIAIPVRIRQTLDSGLANDGDRFSGVTSRAINVPGAAPIPAGSSVSGVVVEAKSPGKFKGEGVLAIRITSVGGVPVRSSVYSRAIKGKGARSAKIIGGTAVGGAVLGGIFGGGKGAAIGALAGGGAGTVGAATTGNKEVVIPAESVVTFRSR